MKWAITGSRGISDIEYIGNILSDILKRYGKPIEFIHGGCWGVDNIGKMWALANGIPVKEFPAQWKKYGKSAGPRRNKEMADYCEKSDLCIAIWDGSSKGTKNMIDNCKSKGMIVEVYIKEK